jgi:hypothetical protein
METFLLLMVLAMFRVRCVLVMAVGLLLWLALTFLIVFLHSVVSVCALEILALIVLAFAFVILIVRHTPK